MRGCVYFGLVECARVSLALFARLDDETLPRNGVISIQNGTKRARARSAVRVRLVKNADVPD